MGRNFEDEEFGAGATDGANAFVENVYFWGGHMLDSAVESFPFNTIGK